MSSISANEKPGLALNAVKHPVVVVETAAASLGKPHGPPPPLTIIVPIKNAVASSTTELIVAINDSTEAVLLLLLPHEVVTAVTEFLADAPTVCRCAQVCRAFHRAIVENERRLWKTLYNVQWPMSISSSNGNGHQVLSYRAEFQRRYKLCATVKQIVQGLSLPLATSQGLEVHMRNRRHWGLHQEEYGRLINLLQAARTNTTKTTAVVFPATATLEVIESLHFFFDSTSPICFTNANDGQAKRVAATERCVASHLLELLHVAHVYQEWQELLVLAAETAADDPNKSDDIPRLLSAGINGIAQILLNEQQVAAFATSRSSVAMAIESSLHDYTAELQSVLQKEHLGSNNNTPVLVVEALLTLMYDTWGFTGNVDDVFDFSNSSLYSVMETKRGNSICLTVLAVLILQRLDVPAHAIGLPGIVVLGVAVVTGDDVLRHVNSSINSRADDATTMSYFDIFHGKRQAVTVRYCRGLIPPDKSWRDDFLKPMNSTAILKRMLPNLFSIYTPNRPPSFRDIILFGRIRLLDSLLQFPTRELATAGAALFGTHNGHDEDEIPGLMPLSLDPQVFINHGLMDASGWLHLNP